MPLAAEWIEWLTSGSTVRYFARQADMRVAQRLHCGYIANLIPTLR